MNVTIINGL